jgi:hypothetical protein
MWPQASSLRIDGQKHLDKLEACPHILVLKTH